jgi:hypothetical protein
MDGYGVVVPLPLLADYNYIFDYDVKSGELRTGGKLSLFY